MEYPKQYFVVSISRDKSWLTINIKRFPYFRLSVAFVFYFSICHYNEVGKSVFFDDGDNIRLPRCYFQKCDNLVKEEKQLK